MSGWVVLFGWILVAHMATPGGQITTDMRRLPTQEACERVRQLLQKDGRTNTTTVSHGQPGTTEVSTVTTTYTCKEDQR